MYPLVLGCIRAILAAAYLCRWGNTAENDGASAGASVEARWQASNTLSTLSAYPSRNPQRADPSAQMHALAALEFFSELQVVPRRV